MALHSRDSCSIEISNSEINIMIQTDTFKLICYNCGATIGLIKSSELIPCDNERMCVDKIFSYRNYIDFKFYCLNCLNKIGKDNVE